MKLSSRVFPFGLGAALFLMLTFPGSAEMRTFTDRQGRKLEAEITGASGGKVTLRMANGKTYTLPVAKFSDTDQLIIAAWKADPKSLEGGAKSGSGDAKEGGSTPIPSNIKYDIGIETDKERVQRGTKKKVNNGELTSDTWVYEVELSNRSRTTLEGLEISYRIYVNAEATAKLSFDPPPKFFGHRAEVEAMKEGSRLAVTTEKFTLNKFELSGDFTFKDGSRNRLDDDLEGIWVKLWHGDKKVAEFKEGGAAVKKAEWPDNEPADPKAKEEAEGKDGQ